MRVVRDTKHGIKSEIDESKEDKGLSAAEADHINL